MAAILQSDGRVALKLPDKFGDRIFWFSSISDSEIETELADKYADPETGAVFEPVATLSRTPLELMAPYDERMKPLYRLLESATKDDLANLKMELSERVGKDTEIYEGVTYQTHLRTGTDLMGNAARMLTLTVSYTRKTV
jgi:hypothetical protein